MIAGPPPAVRLVHVSRAFGSTKAVDDVSLDIADGEFFTLLGPSGSGKTTCLRLIAGFETPGAGHVELFGVDASPLPPYDRDVNTVFQDYALFPHMTVARNVAYGLMVKGVPRPERERRVHEALDLVQLPRLGDRRPSQLSGGQRQRVALARALVNRPRVLLLDEPLGALDLKLRQQMQVELKALQQRVGITFVYVTHDQEEALTMSDRLAVFRDGRVEQVGRPADVYDQPATAFVATFVGTSNVVRGAAARAISGAPEAFGVRPEKMHLVAEAEPAAAGEMSATGRVSDVVFLGTTTRFEVELDAGAGVTVLLLNREGGAPAGAWRGRRVRVCWPASAVRRLNETS